MDSENEVHNAAGPAHPPTEKAPRKPPSPLSLSAISAEGSMGPQEAGLPTRASHRKHNTTATATDKHHGMTTRVKSVRTRVNTSADTGMLHATQRRTQQ